MIHFIPSFLLGPITFILFTLNTVLWCSLLFVFAFLKLVSPVGKLFLSKILMLIGHTWIDCNGLILVFTQKIKWDVRGLEGLSNNGWYLILPNHQTWVDILVLQKIFNHKIPFLKFFLKKELIWVPFLGPSWWALDFPFMKRYSKDFLAKHPELKGQDLETTKKACEKFKKLPVSVINFVEGTRWTPAKSKKSPFKNLLLPKSGGIAFVLSAMGENFTKILDVTLYYPQTQITFWDLCCGKISEVVVRINALPVDKQTLIGDYENEVFRNNFQAWLNGIWEQKDKVISELKSHHS